jgi:predicted phage terminase large subunit-like protein
LWDESATIYPMFEAHPREANLEWRFPSGMRVKFAHLEYDKNVYDWQGSSIPFIGFDELTHFSEFQFFYMMTRNRSTSGARSYIRGTTNPDPNSWVKKFIRWWLDAEGRYADPKKAGVLRWFIRINDSIIWADSAEEIFEQYGRGPEVQPKSVTFIPSKLEDNKILMEKDPGYLANLLAQNRVDRMRLKEGDWLIRASSGMMFQRQWFPIVDAIPAGWIQCIRFWDRAATKPNETNKDPDWTRGLKMYKYRDGRFLVADLKSTRDTPLQVENLIKTTATHDTTSVKIMSQQDPGSAGVAEAHNFIKILAGYFVQVMTTSKDKVTRAKPVSAQSEAGNILILRGSWNEDFFTELEQFSDDPSEYDHDDIVDVLSGAFNELSGGMSIADVL